MAEVIETPMGQETVLAPEELRRQMENRDMSKYIKQEDETYKCRDCGETILAARVAHPIWNGPFPQSGSGKCLYEDISYCPECEQKPSLRGSPIAPKGSYHNP